MQWRCGEKSERTGSSAILGDVAFNFYLTLRISRLRIGF